MWNWKHGFQNKRFRSRTERRVSIEIWISGLKNQVLRNISKHEAKKEKKRKEKGDPQKEIEIRSKAFSRHQHSPKWALWTLIPRNGFTLSRFGKYCIIFTSLDNLSYISFKGSGKSCSKLSYLHTVNSVSPQHFNMELSFWVIFISIL